MTRINKIHTLPPVQEDGKLTITTTYLEMHDRPLRKHAPGSAGPGPAGAVVMRAQRPTVSFYRYLYNTVGADYLWGDRRRWTDEQLTAVIHHEQVHIYVLYVFGVPAGYVELDRRRRPHTEIAYFGLLPEFVGQGYGGYFLRWGIDTAWDADTERVWVHTCTLDHPNARPTYERAGMTVYKEEEDVVDDPRVLGIM